MKIYKEGEKGKAVCHACKGKQDVTFKLADVPLSDGSGEVRNILAGVCNGCGEVVVIPQQSTPIIKAYLETRSRPVESRVPAHLVDILNLVNEELGAESSFSPHIIKYYIHLLSTHEISTKGFDRYIRSELGSGKASRRLSLKGRYVVDDIARLKGELGIEKTTVLLKGVVLKINDDVLVNKKPGIIRRLQGLVAATA